MDLFFHKMVAKNPGYRHQSMSDVIADADSLSSRLRRTTQGNGTISSAIGESTVDSSNRNRSPKDQLSNEQERPPAPKKQAVSDSHIIAQNTQQLLARLIEVARDRFDAKQAHRAVHEKVGSLQDLVSELQDQIKKQQEAFDREREELQTELQQRIDEHRITWQKTDGPTSIPDDRKKADSGNVPMNHDWAILEELNHIRRIRFFWKCGYAALSFVIGAYRIYALFV